MKPIISASNLNHCYGQGNLRKPVLVDINLQIYPGEIVILTGPSGSGKTTLLTLIGALRSLQGGSLKILDYELKGATQTELVTIRHQIGYIFQSHNLLSCLSAVENVSVPLKLDKHLNRDRRKTQSLAMLDAVGLGDRAEYYPDNLSGGQKQRVAIARALVTQPKLILADEPTASLDRQSGRKIADIMQQLVKQQGCAVLLVTHDNRILDIADRIINIEDGQIK
ncbi:MAG: ATP-binding cassette domain-containing protein [Prochloraceae cyanobacterium]|nr:ATP-binding cassette domain-containing protein [Prochloraceae cyanobacterium]